MIDTHCHIQDPQYDLDREQVLERARGASISLICVGTDVGMSQKAITLAEQRPDVWASVGLHPNDNLDEVYSNDIYLTLAQHPRVVAIGEIGLDYYRTTDETKKKIQQGRFLQQLDLAQELGKPVIIHCRDAHKDMITILRDRKETTGVIHSFTGNQQEAEQYVQLGWYVGLNGIITFARQYDPTIQGIPVQNLLLETDAPYLAPVPFRGKRNEPAYLYEVAQTVAAIRGISLQEVERVTDENARKLFKLS